MRDITLTAYDFNELDDNAKAVAYKTWTDKHPTPAYSRADEVVTALKVIQDSIGVTLPKVNYNTETHSFLIDASIAGKHEATWGLKGVRGGKVVLQMYRDLTETPMPLFARFRGADRRWNYGYYENINTYKSRADGYRKSGLVRIGNQSAFMGSVLGRAFARALMTSLRKNYTNQYSVINHLVFAFDAMLNEVVRDYGYQQTYIYFTANIASELEYFADGTVADW